MQLFLLQNFCFGIIAGVNNIYQPITVVLEKTNKKTTTNHINMAVGTGGQGGGAIAPPPQYFANQKNEV